LPKGEEKKLNGKSKSLFVGHNTGHLYEQKVSYVENILWDYFAQVPIGDRLGMGTYPAGLNQSGNNI
jgi:hypothetical protein